MNDSVKSDRDAQRIRATADRHAKARLKICDAAKSVLQKDGIIDFSVNNVAKVAGITKPALYYYFDDKKDLVEALAVQVLSDERILLLTLNATKKKPIEFMQARMSFYNADPLNYSILYVWAPALGLTPRLDSSVECALMSDILAQVTPKHWIAWEFGLLEAASIYARNPPSGMRAHIANWFETSLASP